MKALVFLLIILSTAAHAVIEAPYLEGNFEQNPSHIEWKHITTEHFDIIFPQEVETEAKRVAHLLEKAYPYVTRSLEVQPPKIPLILQNQSTVSNGFVTLAPRRSEWYMTPAIDPELTNTEWLKTLSIHEFRHVVQFQKTRRNFNKVYEWLFGQIGQALGLALTLPPWFLEGDAVGMETALTRGGRGRLPLFDRDLRTILLSGKKWNYDKAHLGSYEDYVPNHYVYGYFYTSWLRNQYGDLFLSKLSDNASQDSWNPLTFYNTVGDETGHSFEEFYESVMTELITEWKNRADKLSPTPYEMENKNKKYGWTNYYYPQSLPDGRIIALKKGLSFIDEFVILDGKKEKKLLYPGVLQNEYPFKVRGNKLAWFEWEVDPRWGYRDYSRLKVYDLKKKKIVVDKREMKGRLAVPDHEGRYILFVEWDEKQGQNVVVLNQKGEEIKRVPWPKSEVITGLDWYSTQDIVIVQRDMNDLKSMVRYDFQNGVVKTLIEKRETNIGFVAVEEGEIFFESPESGIDNIWTVSDLGQKQITSAMFGAYAPDLHKGKLLYNDYSVSGMNVVTKTLPFQNEQHSEGSFYPIYEKFSKSENFSDLEKELSVSQDFEVKDYSQMKNAINLHSWVLLAPPLSNTITVIGYSRDVLNKFVLNGGAEYNLNEQTITGFVGTSWSHYYPVFDLRAAYGNRRQDVVQNGEEFENKWEEGTAELGVSVPWRYIQGRFVHSFTARAFSKVIKVTNKISNDISDINDGALFSPGAEFSYSVYQRFARRDINPKWGFSLSGHAEEGHDITGVDQKGSLQTIDGRIFLPGPWYHHSFYHQIAYENQRNDSYEYASLIIYPRGTKSVFLQEFTKYSGNYLMPLFYPDYNLSRYVYFKRISLNLFYDELNGQDRGFNYRAASTGWEGLFEMSFLRLMLPITIGVRGSYVLDGAEKDSNYEIFLASVLGAF